MRNSKNSPQRQIYSISGLPQEIRNISNKQSNLTPKGTKKKNNKQSTK